MPDSFSGYHPLVNIAYFALVLSGAMLLLHPACLGITLLCGFAYAVRLGGRRAAGFQLKVTIPLLLATAVLSPLFSHEGATILCYLPGGNPLTLESILYGAAAATMLAASITWFSCLSVVITTDKFLYLFGHVIPSLALVLSMTLRLIPRLRAQLRVITQGQRCVGRDVSTGPLLRRLRCAVRILSMLITWALENAIETADSMKSRGYGLPGRSAFSIYRFDRRDRWTLAALALLGGYAAVGAAMGAFSWRYYPTIRGSDLTAYRLSVYAAYFVLCALPLWLDWQDDRAWKTTSP